MVTAVMLYRELEDKSDPRFIWVAGVFSLALDLFAFWVFCAILKWAFL